MELKTWMSTEQPRPGRCRFCGARFANVRDEDGFLPDGLLEENEMLLGFTPIALTLELSHLPTLLGTWCGWRCLELDLARHFSLEELHALSRSIASDDRRSETAGTPEVAP